MKNITLTQVENGWTIEMEAPVRQEKKETRRLVAGSTAEMLKRLQELLRVEVHNEGKA